MLDARTDFSASGFRHWQSAAKLPLARVHCHALPLVVVAPRAAAAPLALQLRVTHTAPSLLRVLHVVLASACVSLTRSLQVSLRLRPLSLRTGTSGCCVDAVVWRLTQAGTTQGEPQHNRTVDWQKSEPESSESPAPEPASEAGGNQNRGMVGRGWEQPPWQFVVRLGAGVVTSRRPPFHQKLLADKSPDSPILSGNLKPTLRRDGRCAFKTCLPLSPSSLLWGLWAPRRPSCTLASPSAGS